MDAARHVMSGWRISTPGQSFQFIESYSGPGISNITEIDRTTVTKALPIPHKYLSALIGLSALGSPALANTVGGVSATANPIAQSQLSVQNQAIQVLQGPYISSQTGTTQCQGPTLNITPFVTYSLGYQKPYEDIYYTPVYNEVDLEGRFDAGRQPGNS